MNRWTLTVLVMAFLSLTAIAAFAQVQEDIQKYPTCKYCGMDRQQFAHSRIYIEYDDGTIVAVCSLHCAAIDLSNNIDRTPKSIKVGDFNGKQLIDAENAFWVTGGKKPGVMSRRGKWAFEKKEDAENFININQGKVSSFEEAMKASYEDMYEDTKMVRGNRNMKKMKMMESKHGSSH